MKKLRTIANIALMLSILIWSMNTPALAASVSEKITDIDLESMQDAPGVSIESIVEDHPDVADEYKDTANTVYTITQNGIYRFTGSLENVQIRVDAPGADDIQIRLDGVSMTNHTAPVIYVKNAAQSNDIATAAIRIYLEPGTTNSLWGSHYAEHTDAQGNEVDHDGAISSAVSLMFEGEGSLDLQADNEGIEGLMHLIFNGGNISILSHDDAINGSTDGQSHIVFNAGRVVAKSILGTEGDGIDSNGYITINGGTVIAMANPNSMDSGLDSDLGISINGGIVAASGNMYDEISESSAQSFIHLVFTAANAADTPVVLADQSGNMLTAFAPAVAFTQMTLSTPELNDGDYRVYTGGSLDSQPQDGLYPSGTAYIPGTLQQNSGSTRSMDRQGAMGGQRPGGSGFPQGDMPQGDPGQRPQDMPERQPPQLPDGFGDGQVPGRAQGERPAQPPEGFDGQNPPLFDAAQPTDQASGNISSNVFSLSAQSYYFVGVQAAQ